MTDNLKVSDEEYIELKRALSNYKQAAEEKIVRYIDILKFASSTALTEGSVAQNLAIFSQHAEGLSGKVAELVDFMETSIDSFTTSIDEADEYLY